MRWLITSLAALVVALGSATSSAAQATTESPHGPGLREACATCHRPDAWKPARVAPTFKHAEKTFPLTGAHARSTCTSCHKALEFAKTPATCASCHTDIHKGEFGATCATCHTTRSFVDRAGMARAHQLTRFPLRGAHATVACESCHRQSRAGQTQFINQPTTCVSCHAATFRATAAPPHATSTSFTQECTSCHTITGWKGAKFDHNTTLFPLTGAHAPVTCGACHADKQYHGRSMACESCHQKDYARTTNPPHSAGFPTTCASCHTTAAWAGARFDHQTMTKFPLSGAHRAATCANCHADKVYRGKSTSCRSCHQANWDRTTMPKHSAAGFNGECSSCHTTTKFAGATFDHTTTRFPLSGAHRTATCANCHADNLFRGRPMECVSCHRSRYDATANPPHVAAGFPLTCQTCHTTTQFKGAVFDHATTRFPLTGAHGAATCAGCHADRVFRGKSMECLSCHKTQYDATANPPHAAAGFVTCQGCHTTTQWKGATFDHATTRFPLTGAHRAPTCAGCHADGVYRGKPLACASCHQGDYARTANPPHAAAGFSTTCQSCHGTTQWKGAVFNHDLTTFPLTGAHRASTCDGCHADKVYSGKPTACASCHQADYNGALVPPHAASGFPLTCQTCHTTTQWRGAPFDHNTTQFPLTGAHRASTCDGCHADKVFAGKPTSCVSCHQSDYNGTLVPPHAASGFPVTCQTCHTTTQWRGAPFNHSATQFPLTGAHNATPCADCHGDNVYRGKPTACVSCHQGDYSRTVNPPHAAAGLPTTCQLCHTTTRWPGATFDHAVTQFPLTGAHRAATCDDCHADQVYNGKPTACVSCHQTDYNGTTKPAHAAAGFPTTCQTCHTTTQWLGGAFDHNATQFPLTGAHRATTCVDCHGDGVYKGKPTACASCHTGDYSASTNPHHAAAGFLTTCQNCHTTTAWTPAPYNHAATAFPLTGAHVGKQCSACHADAVYKGKPTACVSCHLTDYNTSTNPNHKTAQFPTSCQSCHTTTTWLGATFNHDATFFPIYTGNHKGKWATCATCHTNPTNYQVFSCLTCHEHNKTDTDKDHVGKVSGYQYSRIKCYACHPNGK